MAEAKYITRVEIRLTEEEKDSLYEALIGIGSYPIALVSLVEALENV